jgi:hypothetical protein
MDSVDLHASFDHNLYVYLQLLATVKSHYFKEIGDVLSVHHSDTVFERNFHFYKVRVDTFGERNIPSEMDPLWANSANIANGGFVLDPTTSDVAFVEVNVFVVMDVRMESDSSLQIFSFNEVAVLDVGNRRFLDTCNGSVVENIVSIAHLRSVSRSSLSDGMIDDRIGPDVYHEPSLAPKRPRRDSCGGVSALQVTFANEVAFEHVLLSTQLDIWNVFMLAFLNVVRENSQIVSIFIHSLSIEAQNGRILIVLASN